MRQTAKILLAPYFLGTPYTEAHIRAGALCWHYQGITKGSSALKGPGFIACTVFLFIGVVASVCTSALWVAQCPNLPPQPMLFPQPWC